MLWEQNKVAAAAIFLLLLVCGFCGAPAKEKKSSDVLFSFVNFAGCIRNGKLICVFAGCAIPDFFPGLFMKRVNARIYGRARFTD